MQSGLLLLRSALISMSGALVPTFAPLAAAQVALAAPAAQAAATDAQRVVGLVRAAAPAAVAADPDRARDLVVEMRWEGELAQPVLRNAGAAPVAVKEVVLFDIAHGLAPATPFYGEGLQMLAQTAGTLAAPVDVGDYPDRSHYRLPEPEGFRRVYSLVTLEPAPDAQMLVAFTSCSRFVGAFDVSPTRLRAVVDCEGLVIPAGSAWPLEGVLAATGGSRGALLSRLAGEVTKIHPRTAYPAPPAGWCSWYCFGPRVTAKDVLDNLGAMERDYPELSFVQIDDGYQPTMGDWLDTGPGFGGKPVQDILREIKSRGREPAIWVAPFVASPDSKLLRDHPDWFVKGDDGKPMPSDRVMFGGWRLGPWYVLDGTNPAVLAHFERLFATMRREWGVKYFKLDAVFWGMMRGGRLHDPNATRVEAYRAGMRAIRRGAGDDAYILGCNHPIWPSLGLIDGSRSSLDIERNWKSSSDLAEPRAHRRLAQLARHRAQLEERVAHGPREPAARVAERRALVERPRHARADGPPRRRGAVPRDARPCDGRRDARGRRSLAPAREPRAGRAGAVAPDGRRAGVCRSLAVGRAHRPRRGPRALRVLQLDRRARRPARGA
ncbi:MAG: alpha-galactosidase [Planctomycetota bacterium]|nr:alpha-galactosidase [Planctomycetota bacterium]